MRSASRYPKVGTVLLAAGSASRMGHPKQLLATPGAQTFLRRAVSVALETQLGPVVVVLGAHASLLKSELEGVPVSFVENLDWASGIGSSLASGIRALKAQTSDIDAALIVLCDQPNVGAPRLLSIVDRYSVFGKLVVASSYGGSLGVPALFDESLFEALLRLDPKAGAKSLIAQFKDQVDWVEAPEALIDIDTPDEYRRWVDSFANPELT